MTFRARLAGTLLTGLLIGLTGGDVGSAADRDLTGIWSGQYSYPDGSGREAVQFRLFITHDGERLAGAVMERNTFGNGEERWLHAAIVDGAFDPVEGALTFTKRYDGTDDVDHDVAYTGRIPDDGEAAEGTWRIPDSWSGRFQIERETASAGGALDGAWSGTYFYPAGSVDANGTPLRPVKYWLVLIETSGTLRGYMIEPNTFGERDAPWLHALLKGTFDPEQGALMFTKYYDGTGEVGHEVEYTGRLSADGNAVVGSWDIDGFGGTFRLESGGRHPLDATPQAGGPVSPNGTGPARGPVRPGR